MNQRPEDFENCTKGQMGAAKRVRFRNEHNSFAGNVYEMITVQPNFALHAHTKVVC